MAPVILIVDDVEENGLIAEAVLRRALGTRFDIMRFEDWPTARARLGGTRPAAVVLDIEMPTQSGFDILREIRATWNLRDVPVLGWTSLFADRRAGQLLGYGFDAELPKPLESEAMVATFTDVVGKWAQRGSNARSVVAPHASVEDREAR
jgi:chemosensory pili system protein ChpA (sensor histidine kinase/response regulator)